MKTRLTTVVLLITSAVCSVNVAAQFSAPVNQKPHQQKTEAAWELADFPKTDFSQRLRSEKKSFQAIKFNSLSIIEAAANLEFVLPSGKRLTGYRRDAGHAQRVWQGFLYSSDRMPASRISEGAWGEVILTYDGNNISGVLNDSGATYEIVGDSGYQYLVEYLQDESENCLVSVDQSPGDASGWLKPEYNKSVGDWSDTNLRSLAQAQDSGDRVDIMVVYTGATSSYFGGTDQTDLFVQTAVATTNTVFRNSRNRVQINLVGSTQISYSESGNFVTDLNWVKSSPQIAQMRDANFADIVVLIAESGNACGTSQMLTGSGIAAGSGFSVVKRSCAVGGSAFAHEIGHLFGADHDPLDSPIPPAMHVLPYAYGKAVNGQFVTLMGFFSNSVCPAYCPRVLMFSNPAVAYNGTPTGITGERDNARVIEHTADAVANLRTSPQTMTISSPNSNVTWRRNMPREVRWNSAGLTGDVQIQLSRDGGQTFEPLIAETANDGIETVVLSGFTTRQARIRILSFANPKVTDTSLVNFALL